MAIISAIISFIAIAFIPKSTELLPKQKAYVIT
jgi:hypothetical protein